MTVIFNGVSLYSVGYSVLVGGQCPCYLYALV